MTKKFLSTWLVALLLLAQIISMPAASAEDVLVDDGNITVKVTGYTLDPFWGYTMKLYLENKTNKTLMYSIDDCAVDGYMNDPFWATEVMPNSKMNANIAWMDLEKASRIDFSFRVYDSNDWNAEDLWDSSYTLYPLGIENARIIERIPQASDIVLFDNTQATMIITDFFHDDIWGYTANVYLMNKTADSLMFSINNATVNGYMCDPFWATTVSSGMRAYSSISWSDDSLAENGISQITQLVLDINVYNENDWMADSIVDQQFVITPN